MREESESEKDSEFQSRETDSSEDAAGSLKEPELNRPTPSNCTAECCYSTEKVFQPTDKGALATFSAKKRNFQPQWYKQFSWVSVCTTYKKAYFTVDVQLNIIEQNGRKSIHRSWL